MILCVLLKACLQGKSALDGTCVGGTGNHDAYLSIRMAMGAQTELGAAMTAEVVGVSSNGGWVMRKQESVE